MSVNLIFIVVLILSYVLTSHILTLTKIPFMHESSLAIILGALFALILRAFFHIDTLSFNELGFFYFILPPIIFAAGYTLKHHKFIRNLDHILLLGILGTLLTMLLLTLFLSFTNAYLTPSFLRVTPSEILIMASVLSASDTVAVLGMMTSKNSRINQILFGEGVVNDAVAILIFRAVLINNNE